ncbi:MAG: decarboxylating NADP(+)-dependent phosphogluconate dehydrogenase [Actinobacteria bacterium]|nr:decarboxylating NADP(+)-dependent phosphogluconate dehydrogenase [Actinomycetota bacterium]
MDRAPADIGLIGLAVMGQNLVLNLDDHGFTVAVFNRTVSRVDAFLAEAASGTRVIGTRSLEELVAALRPPRRVFLLVRAGAAVDALIDDLVPLLDTGDIIIDGGNSHYADTIRRTSRVESAGLLFVGTGVSGGEEGARRGPSLMPGGSAAAWPHLRDLFRAIAARTPDGEPCCDWVGTDGAGHYVKMVHNGIEYGDMQLIAEAYHLLRDGLGLPNGEMHRIFADWNRGDLDSYLIEITRDILAGRDGEGRYVLDTILDAAGQKGTGKWTVQSATDLGVPMTLVAEAVFARALSALKEDRTAAAGVLGGPVPAFSGDLPAFVEDVRRAVYAAKIVSYAQGFMLMRSAADEHGWALDFGGIADMWRGGCIIRSRFLGDIRAAFARHADLPSLLVDDFFRSAVDHCQPGWRRVVARAAEWGLPLPAMASALAFFDGYRCARLPANLIQAQRDYFGAHTYERTDRPRGEFFHTDWTGRGGPVSSTTYNA